MKRKTTTVQRHGDDNCVFYIVIVYRSLSLAERDSKLNYVVNYNF